MGSTDRASSTTALSCRLLGHRPAFRSAGRTLVWECERGCGYTGAKEYATPEAAQRFASAFDRQDGVNLAGSEQCEGGKYGKKVLHGVDLQRLLPNE